MRGDACDRPSATDPHPSRPRVRAVRGGSTPGRPPHVRAPSAAGPLFLADLLDPPDTSHQMFSKGVRPTESGFPDPRQPVRYHQGPGFGQV